MRLNRINAIGLVALLGCGEPAGPDITVNWITISTRDNFPARAGVVNTLRAVLVGPNNQPIRAGVRVRWLLPPSAGVVDSSETSTGAFGETLVRWTPPTVAGNYDIEVEVVGLPTARATQRILVLPAAPTRVVFATDSVHITRRSGKSVAFRLFDTHGNEHTSLPFEMEALSDGPFSGSFAGFQLSINPGPLARSSGHITLRSSGTVLGRLAVGVDIIIKTVTLSGVDADGLTVGETHAVSFVARDSGDVLVTATPEMIGLSMTSADPTIVAVTGKQELTAVGAGTTVVDMRAMNTVLQDTIEVFAAYDLGARTKLYDIPAPFVGGSGGSGNVFPYAPVLSTSGVSVLPVRRGSGSTRTWYDAQGSVLAVRAWTGGNIVAAGDQWYVGVVAAGDRWYVDDPLTALSGAGIPLWTKSYTGVTGADDALVVIASGTHVHAFTPAGDSVWSYALAGASAIRLSPTRIFLQKDSTLTALDRSGRLEWTIGSFRSTLVDEASNVYGTRGTQWLSYDASGSLRWAVDAPTDARVAFGADGDILLARSDIRSLDRATGQERWRKDLGYFAAALAIVGNRLVVVSQRFLHVYDGRTGAFLGRSVQRHQTGFTGSPLPSPICNSHGLLYAAGDAYLLTRCP